MRQLSPIIFKFAKAQALRSMRLTAATTQSQPELLNANFVAKPTNPSCPHGRGLRGEVGSFGMETWPFRADASLVLKWASTHHTEPEHDQVFFRFQHLAGHGDLGGALEVPWMHHAFTDPEPMLFCTPASNSHNTICMPLKVWANKKSSAHVEGRSTLVWFTPTVKHALLAVSAGISDAVLTPHSHQGSTEYRLMLDK